MHTRRFFIARSSSLLASLIGSLAVVVSACSGSSSSSVSASDACAQAADALCQKYNSCAPFFVQAGYGDVATCKSRVLGNCTGSLSAQGEGNTPGRLSTCAGVVPQISCDDLFAGNIPKDCLPAVGTIKNGSACGDDSQCASSFCGNGGEVCGSCAIAPTEGAACVNGKCPAGLECAGNLCVKPSASGEQCSATKPCRGTLVCAGGTCAQGGKAGDSCDPSGQGGTPCSFIDGIFCNPTTSKCDTVTFAGGGSQCGLVNGKGIACNANTYCKKSAATDPSGTCVARAQDGAGCSDDQSKGAPCLAGAVCSNGVCKVADASTCK